MSQVPCYLRQCQVSVAVKSKQTGVLAATVGVWNCVSEVRKITRGCSIHSTAGWRDLQGLIVHQLEAAEIFCLCFNCSLYCGLPAFPPKWQALTPHRGNLKVQQTSLGTHIYTNHRSTPKSTRDPDLLYPSRNNLLQESVETKKYNKVGFKKKSGERKRYRQRGKKWHRVDYVGMNKRGREENFEFGTTDQSNSHRKPLLMRAVQEKKGGRQG